MKAIAAILFAGFVVCAIIQPACAAQPATATKSVLYKFGGSPDGAGPLGGLIDVNGTFYGTTQGGGTADCTGTGGCGTVYSVDPKTGAEHVIYSFCGSDYPACTDGAYPYGNLVALNGLLYGTTRNGGQKAKCGMEDNGCGTVFAIDPNTGAETVVYSFCSQKNCVDGESPMAGLIAIGGTLYGTTTYGGTAGCNNNAGCGTVFSFDTNTGIETVLWSFNDTDGRNPFAGVIHARGMLYGTVANGGSHGEGDVFGLDLKTGKKSVLYAFCAQDQCADGGNSTADLIYVKGTLFGTTSIGGGKGCHKRGCGTVFAVDSKTGAEAVLHAFGTGTTDDGWYPAAGLVDISGTLYGTTINGGADRHGTLFSVDPQSGSEQVVYSFCGEKCGENPWSDLIVLKGTLYGATYGGGTRNNGTVFAIKP